MKVLYLAIALALMAAPAVPGSAQGGLISLDVHDADLTAVVAMLAAESGVNIVTDGSVRPEKITLHLQGVTFDQALAAIVGAHALQVRRERGIYIVGSSESMSRAGETADLSLQRADPEELAKELTEVLPPGTPVVPDKRTRSVLVGGDSQTLERARSIASTLDSNSAAPGTGTGVRAYHLRFLKPDDVVAKLKTAFNEGAFLADSEQNAVIAIGGDRVQQEASSLIAEVDRESPQVLFEVKVADVTPTNDSSNVGFEFGGLDLNGQPLLGAATYIFSSRTLAVNVRLNALVSNGRASILATPKLVTLNNKEANLVIGETYPIVYSTSVFGGQNVQYVDIGVHLRVTPTIGTDGSVTAELHPEYSELVGLTNTGYPVVANRKIDSVLRVRDNETIVLGGLLRETSNETVSKIPGLADIPIIGGFFRNKQKSHERDEIVFLITPHVLYPGAAPPQR